MSATRSAMAVCLLILVGADAPKQDPPRSPQAQASIRQYNAAIQKASDDYHKALLEADRKLLEEFKTAMSAALKAGNVAEVKRIDAARLLAEQAVRRHTLGDKIPWDAVEFQGHFYKLFPTPMSWGNAEQSCRNMSGHLAYIESAEEDTFIGTLAGDNGPWLGASMINNAREWRWGSGKRLEFTRWAPRQPDNDRGIENCLHYGRDGWGDYIEAGLLSFICEWE